METARLPMPAASSGVGWRDAWRERALADDERELELKRPMREYATLIPEPQFGPLRFDVFPFQQEWYSEEIANAEEVVWRKSSQVGMSAYAWRWAVRQVDQFGQTVLYIFPTDTHVTEFGDERIEPAIEDSPYLRARIPRGFVRHKRLKRIGRGFLHLRGSNSKAGAQSVAAQAIVFDEYDYLDPGNVPQIERRITGARQLGERPRVRRLGYPTIDGYGMADAYEHSDQRVWIVRCGECGHEQELTFEESLRWRNYEGGPEQRAGHDTFEDRKAVAEVWRACRRCGESIEADIAGGRWVAQAPGRKVIGFYVPRLIVPTTDLAQIVVASRSTKPGDIETFENVDLGRPYSASEAQLSAAAILAACDQGIRPLEGYAGPNPVTMGVDVAGERALNVRISEQLPPEREGVANPRRALWIGEADSFQRVVELVQQFGVQMIAIDANPERRAAKALRATFPGRVVLVEYDYKNDSAALKLVDVGEAGTPLEGVPLRVRVNRTEAIDAMMDSIRQARNRPLAEPPPRYIDHLRALKRRTTLDSKGRPLRQYVTTGTQGDDYAHAEVYDLVATEMWRMRAGVQQAQQAPRHVPDEEMGFRRVNLAGGSDGYTPGFGGDV